METPKPYELLLLRLTTPVIPSKEEHPTIRELLDFMDTDADANLSTSERLIADLAIDLYTGRDCQLNQLIRQLDVEGMLALLLCLGAARPDVMDELQRRTERATPKISVFVV